MSYIYIYMGALYIYIYDISRLRIKPSHPSYLPTKMEQTECSETSAYKIQAPGNYKEENIQHSEHGTILKSIYVVSQN